MLVTIKPDNADDFIFWLTTPLAPVAEEVAKKPPMQVGWTTRSIAEAGERLLHSYHNALERVCFYGDKHNQLSGFLSQNEEAVKCWGYEIIGDRDGVREIELRLEFKDTAQHPRNAFKLQFAGQTYDLNIAEVGF